MNQNYEYGPVFQNNNQYSRMSEEEFDTVLIKQYLGDKVEVMYPKLADTSKIVLSGYALLLGPMYYIYRKCFLAAGLLVVGGEFLSVFYRKSGLMLLAFLLVLQLAHGILFYPMYSWEIKRKIKRLKKLGWSRDRMAEVMKSQGGADIFGILIMMIMYFIFLRF